MCLKLNEYRRSDASSFERSSNLPGLRFKFELLKTMKHLAAVLKHLDAPSEDGSGVAC